MEMMLYVISLYNNFEELEGNIRSRKIKKREIIIRIVLIYFLLGIFYNLQSGIFRGWIFFVLWNSNPSHLETL